MPRSTAVHYFAWGTPVPAREVRAIELRISALAIAVLVASSAQAQTPGDEGRVTVVLAGGTSVGRETGGAAGGKAAVRVTRVLDVIVEGTHLWNITPIDVARRAETIALAVGATATTRLRGSVFDAGLRVRWPTAARVQPYVMLGAGAAHVRTETAFTRDGSARPPDALGIQIGRDLTGATTKPTLLLGGGAIVPLARRAFVDLGIRYDRIFARPAQIPGDQGIDVIRAQAGIGIRF